MASSNALLTGLSGLQVNSRRMEVIGNNISNVNTTAFKSNRLLFAPSLSRNLSLGTAPSGAIGGINPAQIGLGVKVAGSQRNFGNGAISTTGVNTDMAIEGDGFFLFERAGSSFFTRAGAFQLNSERDLVTISGERLKGFTVDENFNIIDGQLTDLNIPIGVMTIAEATQNTFMQGNLNTADGGIATQGSVTNFNQPFVDLTSGPGPATGASLLVDNLQDPNNPGNPLFPVANVPYSLTISEAMKGSRTLEDATLTIDATTTMNDLIEFVNDTMGVVTTPPNPDGLTPGAQIGPTGVFSVVGNIGDDNNLLFDAQDFSFTDVNGAPVGATAFTTSTTQSATGESVNTSFIVYDSLGIAMDVSVTMVFDSATTGAGTTWRYYVESEDNFDLTNPDFNVASGTIDFDADGRLLSSTPVSVTIERDNIGSEDPLTFDLHFDGEGGGVTALSDPDILEGVSELTSRFQDGFPLGTLSNFSIAEDGRITGGFTNGRTRVIGQIATATFTNPAGLVDAGNNLFSEGPNSGTAIVATPGQFGTGRVIGGALELSNVDLGQEFINMILTTTGYSASSRVITQADQLLQQLTTLIR
ncbi:MAG: flagellar hook protein FlgE [Planctomycetota bacterium]|jgi:flagellar hook protein FlgE